MWAVIVFSLISIHLQRELQRPPAEVSETYFFRDEESCNMVADRMNPSLHARNRRAVCVKVM